MTTAPNPTAPAATTGSPADTGGGDASGSTGQAPDQQQQGRQPGTPDPTERVRTSSRDDVAPRDTGTGGDAGTDDGDQDDDDGGDTGEQQGKKPTTRARPGTKNGKTRTGDQASPEGQDWKVEDLPPGAQQLIGQLRAEAGAKRTEAKTAAQKAKASEDKFAAGVEAFMKAIGLTPPADEEVDPQQRLTEVTDLYREKTVELAVYRRAAGLGGDPEALLDSRGFLTKVFELDPAHTDFDDQIGELISEAVEKNPKLRAAFESDEDDEDDADEADKKKKSRTGRAASGGEFSGGPAERSPEQFTVDDFRQQRKKARSDGYAA